MPGGVDKCQILDIFRNGQVRKGIVMPEENVQAGEPAGAPDVTEILKQRGIDPGKIGDILDTYATDIKALKGKSKLSAADAAELERLRKAAADAEAANLSEIEKAQRQAAEAAARAEKLEADIKAKDRKLLLEQRLAEQTRNLNTEVAALYSEYVRATVPGQEWDTADDLDPILTAQIERWSKLAPAESGGGIPYGVPGSPQGGAPATSPAMPVVTPDGMSVPFMQRMRTALAGKK